MLLLGLLGHERRLVLGESSADGAGLLGAEVERSVPSTDMLGAWFEGNLRGKKLESGRYALLALVEELELRPLVGVYDGEDASDAFANIMDAGELASAAGDLASAERNQLPSIN